MAEALTEEQLSAIISHQIALAKNHDKSDREASRSKAIDYYLGNMDKYVPPEPNRSKVVSRDVADTVGVLMPGIMRVFTASDRMAIAEPVGSEDTEFARNATAGLNYVFWKDNPGYQVVYNATWDALVTKKAIVKTFYDDTPVYSTSFHSGLTEDQVAQLLMPDEEGVEPEVLASSRSVRQTMVPVPDPYDPASIRAMQPSQETVYDLKIKRKKLDGKFVIEVIPPEEFLIDPDAVETDDAAFTDHWQRKTRSSLVQMGYDKAEVYAIPAAARADTPEEQSRRLDIDGEANDASMELVDYHECFLRVDVDGDGEAELVRACYGGSTNGKLLDWEVWEDDNPFDDIPCEPIPHRWDARSIADETIDIQDVKTVLSRQMLNNQYWVNNPMLVVAGKVLNPEALDSPTFGAKIELGNAGGTVTPLQLPYVVDKILLALQHMDEVRQARTGVGRQSMALDPEALQNQTAEAARNQRDAGYSQEELIARNMAEWGWKKVFRKLLRLMIKHQDNPRDLMINGKPVRIDPRFWNADMDVSVNVGLGTGSRDRDLAMLGNVLQSQLMLADRFLASGAHDDAIDMLPKVIETMTKMAESAGIRNPEDFYPEYTADKVANLKQLAQQAAQQPDPKVQADMAKAQADQQLAQQKAQADLQLQQKQMQIDAMLAQQKLQASADAQQGALMQKQQQLIAEMQLKRDQLAAELQLKREEFMAELRLQRELGMANAAAKVQSASVSSSVHVGGQPG